LIVDTVYAAILLFIYALNLCLCIVNTVLVRKGMHEHYEIMIKDIQMPEQASIRKMKWLVGFELVAICGGFVGVFVYTAYVRKHA